MSPESIEPDLKIFKSHHLAISFNLSPFSFLLRIALGSGPGGRRHNHKVQETPACTSQSRESTLDEKDILLVCMPDQALSPECCGGRFLFLRGWGVKLTAPGCKDVGDRERSLACSLALPRFQRT